MTEGVRRPLWARVGLTLLNLLSPGVGLLPTGHLRPALMLIGAQFAALLLLVLFWASAPVLGFTGYAFSAGAVVVIYAAVLIASLVTTWRRSAYLRPDRRWWSRWYGAVLAVLCVWGATAVLGELPRSYYRHFYVPAESMAPTLLTNDRFVASMRPSAELRRGDLLLVRAGESIYVKRIAALAGDRIAVSHGVVILNGRAVPQRLLRTEIVSSSYGPEPAARLAERFPGETSEHQIYDTGPEAFDDFPEQRVRPGHVFVLGDNRDRSADSRVPVAEKGLEQVPVGDILGRPLFFTWGSSGKLGQSLSR